MIELFPPIKGINKGLPVDKEPPTTSGFMNNVRCVSTFEGRLILCQRPGLDKWSDTQIGDTEQPVVAMCIVAAVA